MNQPSNNQRIAKNTLLLYVRMLFGMLVSLYTSRVILQTLGVEDYGVYNVVGGVISMFTFLNGAMSSATSRYITFEIGKGNMEQLKKVFSTSLQIHAVIALLIVILGETVGLWFLMNELVIPDGRMDAAMWVYQCSIVSCVVGIMSVPYNADIIAHEKMSAICFTIPSLLLFSMGEGVVRLILIVVLSTIVSSFTIYHIGLNEGEKKYLIELTNKVPIIYKIKNKVMEINDKITNRGVKPNLASASCTFGESYSNDMYNFNWRTAR